MDKLSQMKPAQIALLLSLLAILAGYLVSDRIFERAAHIEDEMAYVWQAQVISRGQIRIPSPPQPKSFLVPFVVDFNGWRFAKYPLGWPVVLAGGVLLGIRFLVNPLLGGLGIWLTYRLGRLILGEMVGLLAASLTLISPFFLMNTGSLLSHPLGLVLSTAFALAWLDAFTQACSASSKRGDAIRNGRNPHSITSRRWMPTLVAAFSLGLLALTRPFTAMAVAFPFAWHGMYLLWRGDGPTRRRLLALGAIVLAVSSLHFVWQYALTGDPLLNPYTLWWDYDKVGFGVGHGHIPEGHSLSQAWVNTRYSLWVGYRDLFGWGAWSWIFLPFGLLAIRRNGRAWLVSSVFVSLVVTYLAYWIGSYLFGPRYYYEGLYSLTLLSAAGIAWLAGWSINPNGSTYAPNRMGTNPTLTNSAQVMPALAGPTSTRLSPSTPRIISNTLPLWQRLRLFVVISLLSLLVSTSLIYYTPPRLQMMFGLYDVQRAYMEPFLTPTAQELAPALIVVHTSGRWIEYGTLIELETPFLDTPFIFIIARKPEIDASIPPHFPERAVYHYYPDEPHTFYTAPRP